LEEARRMLEENLSNGKAIEHFKIFLESQGGDPTVVDNPDHLPEAKLKIEVQAKKSGTIKTIIADQLGTAAMLLGAGRATKESVIDLAAGLLLNKKVGDRVSKGEPLLTIHSNVEDVSSVIELIENSIVISDEDIEAPKLIYGTITE